MSRYGIDPDSNDIYYPDTSIPRNHLNIQDTKLLSDVENQILISTIQHFLETITFKTEFNYQLLTSIHVKLFEKLYPFAGVERNKDIHKGETTFCRTINLESFSNDIFSQLKREKYLLNYSEEPKEVFADRLAYYMGEINMLHPFWEGNGRTLRLFIDLIAHLNGYKLINYPDNNYDFINSAKYAVFVDHSKFTSLILSGLSKHFK